jgi:predicted RNA-binding protein with PIN domain
VPILIDGHNLIGRLSTLSLADPDDEERLIRVLRSYQAHIGKAVTVVFDPGAAFALPTARRQGRFEAVFAPHGSTADAVIIRRIKKSRNPRGWLVVTSDRELSSVVESLGARVESADTFAARLNALGTGAEPRDWREEPLSSDEVDAWLDLFESRDRTDGLADTD